MRSSACRALSSGGRGGGPARAQVVRPHRDRARPSGVVRAREGAPRVVGLHDHAAHVDDDRISPGRAASTAPVSASLCSSAVAACLRIRALAKSSASVRISWIKSSGHDRSGAKARERQDPDHAIADPQRHGHKGADAGALERQSLALGGRRQVVGRAEADGATLLGHRGRAERAHAMVAGAGLTPSAVQGCGARCFPVGGTQPECASLDTEEERDAAQTVADVRVHAAGGPPGERARRSRRTSASKWRRSARSSWARRRRCRSITSPTIRRPVRRPR